MSEQALASAKLAKVPAKGRPKFSDAAWERLDPLMRKWLANQGRGAQTRLAVLTGVQPASVTHWLKSTNTPDLARALMIARAIECTAAELREIFGSDPAVFGDPEGPKNISRALGVPESLVLTLWADTETGDQMEQLDIKVRRAALALMHIDGRTIGEVLRAAQDAVAAADERHGQGKGGDPASFDVARWIEKIRDELPERTKSGERESVRMLTASSK